MINIEAPKNKNYCGIVVELSQFRILPNCDNVKAALIFGNSVIVAKSVEAGSIGVFFPAETQLDTEFCGQNNLFRHPEWGNVDATKKGFFEEHGRVKAVKFRGHKSEGFWIPIDSLAYAGVPLSDIPVGSEFDTLNGHEICRKYVSPRNHSANPASKKQGRQPRAEDRIVDGQFRFHIDTENLRRNIHKITPNDWISISDKWHGTSAVFSNILIKRELNWIERLAKRLGVNVSDTTYGFTWSSRRVVKGVDGHEKENSIHYYGTDVWGTVANRVQSVIPKGYTLYGEIVGFTSDGGIIQKGYHYGCQPGTHRFLVYRITTTNTDGRVLEFSWGQMQEFCLKYGLEMVHTYFHGRASDLVIPADDESLESWQGGFLAAIERLYVTDRMCQHNNNEVPAEGIVVKVERLDAPESYKLKNFKFLEFETKQLDAGVVDIEEQQVAE